MTTTIQMTHYLLGLSGQLPTSYSCLYGMFIHVLVDGPGSVVRRSLDQANRLRDTCAQILLLYHPSGFEVRTVTVLDSSQG